MGIKFWYLSVFRKRSLNWNNPWSHLDHCLWCTLTFFMEFQSSNLRFYWLSFVKSIRTKRTAHNYLFKVNNEITRTRYESCSKWTTKTLGQRQFSWSDIFIINFEHVSCLVLVFLLLTLNKYLSVGRRSLIFEDTIQWNNCYIQTLED